MHTVCTCKNIFTCIPLSTCHSLLEATINNYQHCQNFAFTVSLQPVIYKIPSVQPAETYIIYPFNNYVTCGGKLPL